MSSNMSRTTSASSRSHTATGFSVSQPFLGAQLQFLPALGTAELDELIDAYVAGPAPVSEKRATVAMDFCTYAQITGETFRYYPVYNPILDSPASSTLADSGYGSAFNTSPVISDMSWSNMTSPAQSFASATPSQKKARLSTSSRKGSKPETTDFSHLPGMRIMTKEGVDVTQSAARSCKTKEQRDHAHLMRILKACDACKKKKIKCDPSHRKRAASEVDIKTEAKPPKKTKKAASTSVKAASTAAASQSLALDPTFSTTDFTAPASSEEDWSQFIQFDEAPVNSVPQGYNFYFGAEDYYSPATSGSPIQPVTPAAINTPSSAGLVDNSSLFPKANTQQPTLPYLDNNGAQGSNYVDFNLYSPKTSFLDEDDLKPVRSNETRAMSPRSATQHHNVETNHNSYNGVNSTRPSSTGPSSARDQSIDCAQSSFDVSDPGWGIPDAGLSSGIIGGGYGYAGNSGISATTESVQICSSSSGLGQGPTRGTGLASMSQQEVSHTEFALATMIPHGFRRPTPRPSLRLQQGLSHTTSPPVLPQGVPAIGLGVLEEYSGCRRLESSTNAAHSLRADKKSGKDGLARSTLSTFTPSAFGVSSANPGGLVSQNVKNVKNTVRVISAGLQGGLQGDIQQGGLQQRLQGGLRQEPSRVTPTSQCAMTTHAAGAGPSLSQAGYALGLQTQLDVVHTQSGLISGLPQGLSDRSPAAVISSAAGVRPSLSSVDIFTTDSGLFTPVRQSSLARTLGFTSTPSSQLVVFGLVSLLLVAALQSLHDIFTNLLSSHSGLFTLLSLAPLLVRHESVFTTSSTRGNLVNNVKSRIHRGLGHKVSHYAAQAVC